VVVKKRASLPAILAVVPMLLCAVPARAAAPLVDDALVLWDWIARTIATMARCADYDYDRREQHLDLLEQYFNEVKDAQAKIESVLVQDATRSGSRSPARDTTKRMDAALVAARAVVDEQNQGHDIRFIKNVCKGLPDDYRADKALFTPLTERFPSEAKALSVTAP
jgi:hypothetical protein